MTDCYLLRKKQRMLATGSSIASSYNKQQATLWWQKKCDSSISTIRSHFVNTPPLRGLKWKFKHARTSSKHQNGVEDVAAVCSCFKRRRSIPSPMVPIHSRFTTSGRARGDYQHGELDFFFLEARLTMSTPQTLKWVLTRATGCANGRSHASSVVHHDGRQNRFMAQRSGRQSGGG